MSSSHMSCEKWIIIIIKVWDPARINGALLCFYRATVPSPGLNFNREKLFRIGMFDCIEEFRENACDESCEELVSRIGVHPGPLMHPVEF